MYIIKTYIKDKTIIKDLTTKMYLSSLNILTFFSLSMTVTHVSEFENS